MRGKAGMVWYGSVFNRRCFLSWSKHRPTLPPTALGSQPKSVKSTLLGVKVINKIISTETWKIVGETPAA